MPGTAEKGSRMTATDELFVVRTNRWTAALIRFSELARSCFLVQRQHCRELERHSPKELTVANRSNPNGFSAFVKQINRNRSGSPTSVQGYRTTVTSLHAKSSARRNHKKGWDRGH